VLNQAEQKYTVCYQNHRGNAEQPVALSSSCKQSNAIVTNVTQQVPFINNSVAKNFLNFRTSHPCLLLINNLE